MSTCGYTIIDGDGNEAPCDQPATGWRWYQGHFHEDMLDVACDEHENEGGRRIHEAEERLRAVEALLGPDGAARWGGEPDGWLIRMTDLLTALGGGEE